MTKVDIKTLKGKEEEEDSLFISAPDTVNDDFKAESGGESDSDGDVAHSNLISEINKLNSKKRLKAAPRNVRFLTGEGGTSVNTEDILNRIGFSDLKKTTQRIGTLPKPVEKVTLKRLKRSAGYDKVSCEAEKWGKLVKIRRTEDQLSFPLQKADVRTYTTLKTEEIKPRTTLEKEVYALLHGAKLMEDVKKTNEEKMREKAMSLEELKERNKLAWKEKQQRRRLEKKAWMQNKSKSRKYHKLLRRDRLKKEKAELEALEKENPEAALERIEELEKARILERMSLRHKKSKWTKFQGLRATRDENAREALKETKSMHEELVEKRRRGDSSSEDDENEEELNKKLEALRKEKQAALSAGLFDPSNPWTANLMHQLPQRAEAAVEDAIDDSFVNFKKFWEEVNQRKVIEKKAREVAEKKQRSLDSENKNSGDGDDQGLSDKMADGDSETKESEAADEEGKDDSSSETELKSANLFQVEKSKENKLKDKHVENQSDGEEQMETDLEKKLKAKKATVKRKGKQKADSKVLGSKVKKKSKLTDSKGEGVKAKKKVKSKKQINGDGEEKEDVIKGVKGKKTKKKLKVKAKAVKSDAEEGDAEISSKEGPKGKKKAAKESAGKKIKKKVKKGKDSKSKEESNSDEDEKPATNGEVMDLEEQLVSIDNMFNQAELSIKRKLNKRLMKLGIDSSKKDGWTKVDSKNKKRKRDDGNEKGILPKIEEFDFTSKKDGDNIDEGTERARTLEDMDRLQKKTEGLDSLQKAVKTLKGGESGKDLPGTGLKSDKKQPPKAVQVDPSKFLQVDPKVLQGAMPDSISKGDEDALDDFEDDGDADDIIQEAFADDYLVDEFKAEKDEAIEKDKPKEVSLKLPGWGSWTGPNIKANRRKHRKFMAPTTEAPPRKDAHLSNVIYNEKADVHDNLRKAMVTQLPYPFSRVRDFEASIRAPIGRQFVPEKEHKQLIKPPVVTKLGRIIEPMTEEELLKCKDKGKAERKKIDEEHGNKKMNGRKRKRK